MLDITLSLGIETMGAVATQSLKKTPRFLQRNHKNFSHKPLMITKQPLQSMWFRGERKQAAQNKSLGRFDLADIPPAPRGMPQIEVTFDIDANGILNVSAKDKATAGKSNRLLSKPRLVCQTKKLMQWLKMLRLMRKRISLRNLPRLRNAADGLTHAAKKTLEEAGDKASEW